MPKFAVHMPITGRAYKEVEADDEEHAIEVFFDTWDSSDNEDVDAVEWEFTEHVTRGNCCSAMQNDVRVLKRAQ